MHLTNHGNFDYLKNPEDPKIELHARLKMAQVLGSLVYICGIHDTSVHLFELIRNCELLWDGVLHAAVTRTDALHTCYYVGDLLWHQRQVSNYAQLQPTISSTLIDGVIISYWLDEMNTSRGEHQYTKKGNGNAGIHWRRRYGVMFILKVGWSLVHDLKWYNHYLLRF